MAATVSDDSNGWEPLTRIWLRELQQVGSTGPDYAQNPIDSIYGVRAHGTASAGENQSGNYFLLTTHLTASSFLYQKTLGAGPPRLQHSPKPVPWLPHPDRPWPAKLRRGP